MTLNDVIKQNMHVWGSYYLLSLQNFVCSDLLAYHFKSERLTYVISKGNKIIKLQRTRNDQEWTQWDGAGSSLRRYGHEY
jgi:hypothetical protein